MNQLLAKLPAFALPFVTRSLRGGRAKRYLLFSLLLAIAPLLLGLSVGVGDRSFAQSVRTDLGFEAYEWDREQTEFTVYVHSKAALRRAEASVEHLRQYGPYASIDDDYGEVLTLINTSRGLIAAAAAWPDRLVQDQAALRERARAFSSPAQNDVGDDLRDYSQHASFAWRNPKQVATLERVLDAGGIPQVRMYESPLSWRDAFGIVGFLAGLALAAFVTVLGPLLVGVQQAQERHENTLMPLTGTGLKPHELAQGLASGPTVVVAIFAIPQLAVFGLGALIGGRPMLALGLVAALAASGLFLTFAAQLLGHLVGHRRTPGIIGIALLSMLGIAWLTGAAFATELDHSVAGLAALLPTIGLTGMLGATFLDIPSQFDIDGLLLATTAWSTAALVFAALTITALARKIEGREGPLLGAGEALVGALTCIALIHVAVPWGHYDSGLIRLYVGLAGLALPFALLLMARVPIGDNPVALRRIPVPKLLLEFAGWYALHVLLTMTVIALAPQVDGPRQLMHPIALLWAGWCVGVLGLIAIRLVAVPASIAAHLWTGFCAASLLVGFGQAVYWGVEPSPSIEDVFVFAQLSPVLGLVQVGLTLAIPISLVRHLRKNLGSVTGAEPSIPTETR